MLVCMVTEVAMEALLEGMKVEEVGCRPGGHGGSITLAINDCSVVMSGMGTASKFKVTVGDSALGGGV